MGTYTDRLVARHQPVVHAFGDPDGILAAILAAIGDSGQLVDDIARDTDTHIAWAPALDPDTAPAPLLTWLAQFPGVNLLPSDTEADRRARIKTAAGIYKGTLRAIREEAQLTLTGTKTVRLVTHVDGDRWLILMVTSPAETPDPAATLTAATRQKPGGFKLTHVVSAVWLIAEMEQIYAGRTLTNLETDFATIATLEAHTP